MLLSTRLVALLATANAHAGQADAVARLLGTGDLAAAAAKCTKWDATTSVDARLREVCAQAAWSAALTADPAAGWAPSRAAGVGTSWADAARDKEALAAVREHAGADETSWLDLAERYTGTQAAATARQRAGAAAVAAATTDEAALRAVADWPDAPGARELAAAHLGAFAIVDATTSPPTAALRGASDAWPDATARWVWRDPQGSVHELDAIAAAELERSGVPATWLAARPAGTPTWPLCAPLGGGDAGVEVSWIGATHVAIQPWEDGCDSAAAPGLVAWHAGRPRAIWPGAGSIVTVPHAPGVVRTAVADVPVFSQPGAAVIVDGVLGQPVGEAWLLQPLYDSLPFYVLDPPPEDALELSSLRGLPLPPEWTVGDQVGAVRGPGEVVVALDAPTDEVTAWSPLLRRVLGVAAASAVPALPTAGWTRQGGTLQPMEPAGAQPVAVDVLPGGALADQVGALAAAGARPSAWRAWSMQLDDDPEPGVIVDALAGGKQVRALRDRSAQGELVAVLELAGGTPFAFELADRRYVAWVDGDHIVALHLDPGGVHAESVTP